MSIAVPIAIGVYACLATAWALHHWREWDRHKYASLYRRKRYARLTLAAPFWGVVLAARASRRIWQLINDALG